MENTWITHGLMAMALLDFVFFWVIVLWMVARFFP